MVLPIVVGGGDVDDGDQGLEDGALGRRAPSSTAANRVDQPAMGGGG